MSNTIATGFNVGSDGGELPASLARARALSGLDDARTAVAEE